MITKEQIIDLLKTIEDPEIRIDIWTLELIYDIKIEDENINIVMTFTSPMCPYGPMLVDEIKRKLNEQLKPKSLNIEVVFSPAWKPSDELRAALGV